jgi:hypothetical protein
MRWRSVSVTAPLVMRWLRSNHQIHRRTAEYNLWVPRKLVE